MYRDPIQATHSRIPGFFTRMDVRLFRSNCRTCAVRKCHLKSLIAKYLSNYPIMTINLEAYTHESLMYFRVSTVHYPKVMYVIQLLLFRVCNRTRNAEVSQKSVSRTM